MKKKIKILYVVSTLIKCGPTNQLYGIIKNLDKDLFDVTILTLFNEEINTEKNKFINEKIKIDSLDLVKTKNYYKITKKLIKYCTNKNIDIIHSCGLAADFSTCFIKNTIHISSIRNYAYFDYISAFGNLFGHFMIMLNKWAIEHTHYPICCSKSIMIMYKKHIFKEMYYIQNGVDINRYYYNSNENQYFRKKLDLPLDKKIIIVSGSLTERKDPKFILEAFKKIDTETIKNCCLIFIGDGDLYNDFKKFENDQILVKGQVDNVVEYLKASDIYVSASKSEGLPNSVLEAAACGLELILSDIPQHREIFEKDESIVNFFKLNSVDEFINKINKVLNNENEKVKKYISEYIIENFSSKSNSEKYSIFYKNVISKNNIR